jgi:hypothetical protein
MLQHPSLRDLARRICKTYASPRLVSNVRPAAAGSKSWRAMGGRSWNEAKDGAASGPPHDGSSYCSTGGESDKV